MQSFRYSAPHRFLHAVMALLIPVLFGLGVWMVDLGFYDSWYHKAPDLHKALGVLTFFLLLPRLVYALMHKKPQQASTWSTRASQVTHVLMYLLLVVIFVSGYLIATAAGDAVSVFGWFDVPALPALIEQQADIAGDVHQYAAWSLIGLIGLHIAAALKHAWLNKDDVMQRMWGRAKQ